MSRPHRLGLSAVALALSLGACEGRTPNAVASAPNAAPAVLVETLTVTPQPLKRELAAVGSVRSQESVIVRPEIAGRIDRIGFDEGRPVKSGQLLFALDDAVHRAELEQARASELLARRSLDRASELLDRKLLSQADRDQAAANHTNAAAALALAQARLDKTRIVAPFDGIAGLRLVSSGDYVEAGRDLANIESLDRVKVDFRLDESALPQLHVGQALEIEVDAYPGERFTGAVYAIDPRIAETTRSIGLRAQLPNPGQRLRPGQFARVHLLLAQKSDALMVPEQAVFPRGDRQYVYVIENGHAQQREIRVGQRAPGAVEVVDGLSAGETLVAAGLQRLSDGIAVRTAEGPAAGD